MKTVFILSVSLILTICINAQVPQSLNYQAGVYDAGGTPIFNHQVNLRLTITDTSASGPVLYKESFATSTDVNGLFNVNIGLGNVISGAFDSIDWSNGNKWLKTEVDTGAGYIVMGATKFLSVPYALYSEKSKSNLSGFGRWSFYGTGSVYHAQTDGFVKVVIGSGGTISPGCMLGEVLSDSTSSPYTSIAQIPGDEGGTVVVPIRKNDYWKVTTTGSCFSVYIRDVSWLPLR